MHLAIKLEKEYPLMNGVQEELTCHLQSTSRFKGAVNLIDLTKKHITNSSRRTFKSVAAFAKNAKPAPLLKAPDEGVRAKN